jgi:hypothetical protein
MRIRRETHDNRSSSTAPIEPAHDIGTPCGYPAGLRRSAPRSPHFDGSPACCVVLFHRGVLAIVDGIRLPTAQAQELIFVALGPLDLAISVLL